MERERKKWKVFLDARVSCFDHIVLKCIEIAIRIEWANAFNERTIKWRCGCACMWTTCVQFTQLKWIVQLAEQRWHQTSYFFKAWQLKRKKCAHFNVKLKVLHLLFCYTPENCKNAVVTLSAIFQSRTWKTFVNVFVFTTKWMKK